MSWTPSRPGCAAGWYEAGAARALTRDFSLGSGSGILYNGSMTYLKRTILAFAVFVFAAGTVQAQNWAGLRTGYPLGVTVHVGAENAIGADLDIRVSGRVESVGSSPRIGLAVDLMRSVGGTPPFDIYAGGGPSLSVGGGAAFFGIHGLLGGEYRLSEIELDQLGVFAELSLGAEIDMSGGGSARLPTFGAAVGFNWHF